MNIAFLLGAGVSILANMHSTKDLTNEILNDKGKWCSTFNSSCRFKLNDSFDSLRKYQ